MTLEERVERLEKDHRELNGLVSHLKDAMIVTAEIQHRQSEVQRTQAQELDAARERLTHVEASVSRLDAAVNKLSLVADELADKLNGLIGYIDTLPKNPPPR